MRFKNQTLRCDINTKAAKISASDKIYKCENLTGADTS